MTSRAGIRPPLYPPLRGGYRTSRPLTRGDDFSPLLAREEVRGRSDPATRGRSGFTTIELTVTLAVLVVMSTVVVVAMGPALAEARLRSGCRMVLAALNYARSYAAARQTYTMVVLDRERATVGVRARVRDIEGDERMAAVTTPSGRTRQLPRGVRLLRIEKPMAQDQEDFVVFTPLGQSDEAAIVLGDNSGATRTVAVEALTGRCAVSSGKPHERKE